MGGRGERREVIFAALCVLTDPSSCLVHLDTFSNCGRSSRFTSFPCSTPSSPRLPLRLSPPRLLLPSLRPSRPTLARNCQSQPASSEPSWEGRRMRSLAIGIARCQRLGAANPPTRTATAASIDRATRYPHALATPSPLPSLPQIRPSPWACHRKNNLSRALEDSPPPFPSDIGTLFARLLRVPSSTSQARARLQKSSRRLRFQMG